MQTYLSEAGHPYSAPYWMGEFGTGDNGNNWNKIGRKLTPHLLWLWDYMILTALKVPISLKVPMYKNSETRCIVLQQMFLNL